MSTSNNATVPSCSAHVSAGQYSVTAQANYNPTNAQYYKNYVTSAQVLPGLIFGVLCWIGAIIFVIWLLTLCCRSVAWRSRRFKTHDVNNKGRTKWAVLNVALTVATLAVIGTGTWALISGLKSTDGQVKEFWGLVAGASTTLGSINVQLSSTNTALVNLGTSLTSCYNLVNGNQAAASYAGLNPTGTLAVISTLQSSVTSGESGVASAQTEIGTNGLDNINTFQSKYQKKSTDAWATYRPIAVAVFFGLLIFFGTIAGFLAVLDRTPRLLATFTLLLLIWTGFVLLFGTGLLNVVWRVTRDSCLYGISFAATKFGGGGTTTAMFNYYFQKTYIAPSNVSYALFGINLPATISLLTDPTLLSFAGALNTTNGQAFVATASAADQANINALNPNIYALGANLTALNNDIQVQTFLPVTNGILGLICCSITNALWNLWLASVITGAFGGLLSVLAIIKNVSAIQPLERNQHYTPHDPNSIVAGTPTGTATVYTTGPVKGHPV